MSREVWLFGVVEGSGRSGGKVRVGGVGGGGGGAEGGEARPDEVVR